MIKKFDIWNSRFNVEDWKDFIEEDKEMNPAIYEDTDEEYVTYLRISEMNEQYLEDERFNLNRQLDHPILIIADLGLWYGRRTAYKIIDSGKISDILSSQVSGGSELHWYCDGYNIRCDEAHHDGTNHYIYREIRNPENIDVFLDKIRSGEKIKKSVLNYYTRSIAPYVGRVYGFCA